MKNIIILFILGLLCFNLNTALAGSAPKNTSHCVHSSTEVAGNNSVKSTCPYCGTDYNNKANHSCFRLVYCGYCNQSHYAGVNHNCQNQIEPRNNSVWGNGGYQGYNNNAGGGWLVAAIAGLLLLFGIGKVAANNNGGGTTQKAPRVIRRKKTIIYEDAKGTGWAAFFLVLSIAVIVGCIIFLVVLL